MTRTDSTALPGWDSAQWRPVKPQPLTEFQMLVAGAIGHIVPVYGADLFANVPDTFAPVQRLPVTPDYVIGPGDELLIRTWGQVTQNLHLTVDRSGSVYIPQVGEFRVAGLPFRQLRSFLKARFDRVYRNYDLNVNLGQLRSIQVFVTGEARRPGSYTISSLSTLVNAVFACGGPGPQGSLRHIQLKRNGQTIADFDLYDLLLKGDKSKDANLETGDVLYFPPMGRRSRLLEASMCRQSTSCGDMKHRRSPCPCRWCFSGGRHIDALNRAYAETIGREPCPCCSRR